MSQYRHIFSPIQIGRISLKNRIEFPPVGPHLATSDGFVSRELIEWGRQFARGGAAIVTLGDTSTMAPRGAVHAGYALHLGNDKCLNPLNRFAETIQRYGARASIQLNYHPRSAPAGMTHDEIKELIESYASAAYRCLCAGMDMVMVHGAHGHIFSQFVSPRLNTRSDEYGGSLANRARLAVSVLEAIREKAGDKLAIEYRISGDEMTASGPSAEEQIEFAALIQDKIDLIHVSMGNLFDPATLPMINQPAYFPRGLNLKYAEAFKKALKIPVVTVGSYNLDMAEQILSDNKADMVAMARSLIADPDSLRKAQLGLSRTIRPCIRCNHCINRSHTLFLSTRCTVNPVIGREAEFFSYPPAAVPKKVLVVGGGPAGMEAARTAAARGHLVVLMEASGSLGGMLDMAAAAPFKADMKKYLEWAVNSTLTAGGLEIRLNSAATAEKVRAEKADVLIIAAGSTPLIPPLPGIKSSKVVLAGEVEMGRKKVGGQVLVAGAGLVGSETALHLAQEGHKVTIIDALPMDRIDTGASAINSLVLRSKLNELKVEIRADTRLEAVTADGVEVRGPNSEHYLLPCDTVVLALGFKPRSGLAEELKGLAPEVYIIGDCNHQRGNLLQAVSEGFFAAMDI